VRVVYVTSTLPHGSREAFLIAEIAELQRSGHELEIVPMRPRGAIAHDDARPLAAATVAVPLISGEILAAAVAEGLTSPVRTLRAFGHVLRSRNAGILAKNLGVFPKGVWLGRRITRLGADHLHAHWASTSSTMALVAAEISGVPWSFTAHRWDIAEDNLLELKAARACFVRAISERGARSIAGHLAGPARDLHVLHVGIDLPGEPQPSPTTHAGARLRVLVAADFFPVKGHRHLLDACRILAERGCLVHVDLAGEGPLRSETARLVVGMGLAGSVTLLGTVPHASLLDDLNRRRWDVVALPSVASGEVEEGIPVSLMEAMGARVAVIATRTGAIPELLDGGAGILVPAEDPAALADALEALARDPALRECLAREGRRRVQSDFDVGQIAAELARRFAHCTPSGGGR
jgi:colanic acid/amylovoran biosynthesis glycosyltransferase